MKCDLRKNRGVLMNKVLKAVAGAMCAMTVLFTGVTVFAVPIKPPEHFSMS